MELKDKLIKIRTDNNLTLEELVQRLNRYEGVNISKGTVSRWEHGQREPKNTYISAYAKEFDISLNHLYGLDEETEDCYSLLDKVSFTDATEATRFLLEQNVIMGFNGLDITKLNEEEQIEYANEILNQIKLVSYKYKDKKWHR